MRILWSSNAPWVRSGYGVQTKLFTSRLRQHHDIGICGWWGLQGGMLNLDGIPVYPAQMHSYGQDATLTWAAHFRADCVITLIDAWVYQAEAFGQLPWCPWFPIDHDPIPPPVARAVKGAYQPICFSQHAMRACEVEGINALYVPHGVDTEAYKPMDRAEARRLLQWPADAFIITMVAANKGMPSRKAFPECLRAFALFRRNHEDAWLYLHTLQGGGSDACNLPEMAHLLGIEKSVAYVHPTLYNSGLNEDHMRAVYCASDVLLNPAYGEGFGVPILEAQACGTRVIVGDWTSMGELCFGGWAIPESESEPYWTGLAASQHVPHIAAIYERLELAYTQSADDRAAMQEAARAGALPYDADTVTRDHWLPVLAQIEKRIKDPAGKLQLVQF